MANKIKKSKILIFLIFLIFLFSIIPWNRDYFFNKTLLAQSNLETFENEVVWTSISAPEIIDDKEYHFKNGLKVEAGVEIVLKNESRLIVEGDFEVLGTIDEPVIFRGFDDKLENFSISVSQAEKTYINNAIFEKGGNYNCLAFNPQINVFQKVFADGCLPTAVLNIRSSKELVVNNSIFKKNYRSMNIREIESGILTNNSFLYNDGEFEKMAVYSDSETTVSLKSNCWMKPSGPTYEGYPNGRGEKIEGNFNIEFPQECGSEFKPVILIPGIGGSWNWEVMLENKVASDKWKYAPSTHFYDAWEDALEVSGYQKNRDYFVVYYDWRQENSQSMEKFLKPTLEKIQKTSFDLKYDIIAHSMGGFVTLDYLTSEAYQDNIDKVVLQGTPLAGSNKVYSIWEGGVIPEDWGAVKHYLSLLASKEENENLDDYDLIHKYVPSIKQLLPIYPYLKDNNSEEMINPWNMKEQNNYLPELMMKIGQNQNNFNFNGNLLMIQGTGQDTSEIITVNEYSGEKDNKLWLDGYPKPYPLEKNSDEGDGTVLNISSEALSLPETITLENVIHSDLPSQSIQETGDFLGINFKDKDYPLNIKDKILMIFACPIDIQVEDSNGNYINKNDKTLENAFYYSDEEEDGYRIIEIQNPTDQNYSIEITANATGDFDGAIYNYKDNGVVFGEFSGEIQKDEKIVYSTVLNTDEVVVSQTSSSNNNEEENQNDEENNDEQDSNDDEDQPSDDEEDDEDQNDDDDDQGKKDKKGKKNKKVKKDKKDKQLGYIKNQEKKEALTQKQADKKEFIENKKIAKNQTKNQKNKTKPKVAGAQDANKSLFIIPTLILIGVVALYLTWTVGKNSKK